MSKYMVVASLYLEDDLVILNYDLDSKEQAENWLKGYIESSEADDDLERVYIVEHKDFIKAYEGD